MFGVVIFWCRGYLECIRSTYVCHFFALLPTFLFVRALFGKTPSSRTDEARADTLVEVSALSVHSGARGGRSKFFLVVYLVLQLHIGSVVASKSVCLVRRIEFGVGQLGVRQRNEFLVHELVNNL